MWKLNRKSISVELANFSLAIGDVQLKSSIENCGTCNFRPATSDVRCATCSLRLRFRSSNLKLACRCNLHRATVNAIYLSLSLPSSLRDFGDASVCASTQGWITSAHAIYCALESCRCRRIGWYRYDTPLTAERFRYRSTRMVAKLSIQK